MIVILEKYEHNTDFYQIVDFVEASHLRYALTINPTVYVSHIRQFWSTTRIETMDDETKILATIDGKLRTISESSIRRNLKLRDEAGISSLPDAELFENLTLIGDNILPNQKFSFQKGSRAPTEPHHTPSPEAQLTSPTATSSPSLPPSLALPTAANKHASPIGDDSQGKACPTVSGLEAEYDRANITKTSTLPSDSTPRVTSLAADEGSMQQQLNELTDLYTRLQRQQTEMASKIVAQDLEISQLKARVKLLEDRDRRGIAQSGENAPIKGRRLETGEEAVIERMSVPPAAEVPTVSIPPAAEIPTGSGFIPTASTPGTGVPTGGVPTGSDVVPTASPIFTTATVATPYTRRKGKEKMVELDTPKKRKLQEQMDLQMARQLEEEMERDAQRMNAQIARDAEIARIHAEEEFQIMIDGLDRNNETFAKYLQEYHQFATEFPIGRRIELISDLVKYQDNYAKVLKYHIQQRKPLTKKQQKELYMSVLRSHAGWKTRHFNGMTLEEIKEKFDPVWKQIEDFIPIGSKEEGETFKRKGLRLEHDSAKKVKHPINDWEIQTEGQRSYWKIIRLGGSTVELKRLYEPDVEDQLWTHTQTLMHDPVEWRLYDSCGVHHILSRDQEIFMLVEREYLLRKGLAIVMIKNKLQVENYSQMASDLIQKIHKIANSPRQ
nr:hypothetical protein [Tanacetum cinerariifolium]